MDVQVTLGTMPGQQATTAQVGPGEQPPEVGLGLQVGTAANGDITVVGMNPDGTAAAAGLREGDVIQAVDDTTITSFDDLQTAIETARDAGNNSMLFQISRDGDVLFLAVDTWVND